MSLPERSYISNNEILFMGYSSKKESFSRMLYKEFNKAGIEVFPYNPGQEKDYDIPVFNAIDKMEKVPETAYILMKRENAARAVNDLEGTNVKRVLFQSKKLVPQEALDKCDEMGIETAFACPMMLIGGGIHKIHRFFASLSSK